MQADLFEAGFAGFAFLHAFGTRACGRSFLDMELLMQRVFDAWRRLFAAVFRGGAIYHKLRAYGRLHVAITGAPPMAAFTGVCRFGGRLRRPNRSACVGHHAFGVRACGRSPFDMLLMQRVFDAWRQGGSDAVLAINQRGRGRSGAVEGAAGALERFGTSDVEPTVIFLGLIAENRLG